MTNITTNANWYEEIKEKVATYNAYYYEENNRMYVEFDVADEEEFNKVSEELGWMQQERRKPFLTNREEQEL